MKITFTWLIFFFFLIGIDFLQLYPNLGMEQSINSVVYQCAAGSKEVFMSPTTFINFFLFTIGKYSVFVH